MKDSNEVEINDSEMSEEKISIRSSVIKSMMGLGLFAVLTAGLIAVTQSGTKNLIHDQVNKAKYRSLLQIVPLSEHDNDLLKDGFFIHEEALGQDQIESAYIAKKNKESKVVILPVTAPQGYSGKIKLIVGIDVHGEIKGVRVVSHKETPGLGDKIEIKKSDWIEQFSGKSFSNTPKDDWKVEKDGGQFDGLTGATITPRAIVSAVLNSLFFFEANKETLLKAAPGSTVEIGLEKDNVQ